MTTIAELFVALGVKGSEKTVGAIGGVNKGLKETASTSIEAKAAIVGAMYALERMFATSGKAGTDLTNFTSLVGVSAKTLQQYQYAARQVGVSNDEMAGTFKALQSTMTKTLMGEGAPKGLARFAQLTGDISPADLKRFAEQPQLLIQRFQEYLGKETNLELGNEVGKSFGFSDNMISAMRRNAFRPDVLNKAPTYSDSEVKNLDKANIAWSNLGNKIEMAFGHFNAKHGTQITGDIGKIVDKVIILAEAFERLSEKMQFFKLMGKVFEGWTYILDGVAKAVTTISDAASNPHKMEELESGIGSFFSGLPDMFKAFAHETFGTPPQQDAVQRWMKGTTYMAGTVVSDENGNQFRARNHTEAPTTNAKDWLPLLSRLGDQKSSRAVPAPVPHSAAANAVPPQPAAGGNTQKTMNVNVNQNMTFSHPGTDPKDVTDTHKQSVQKAYRQITAIGNGG